MLDERSLALGETYFANWLVMRAELSDAEMKAPCARCGYSRECHVGDGGTNPAASGETVLCTGFVHQ